MSPPTRRPIRPATALTAERISERFEVDNTPPVIEHLEAAATPHGDSPSKATVAVKFTARDAGSSVERAQYSLDGGDWILVSPAGNISDAPEEQYEFSISDLSAGEHTIAVRAYDRFENVGSGKTIVTVDTTPTVAEIKICYRHVVQFCGPGFRCATLRSPPQNRCAHRQKVRFARESLAPCNLFPAPQSR